MTVLPGKIVIAYGGRPGIYQESRHEKWIIRKLKLLNGLILLDADSIEISNVWSKEKEGIDEIGKWFYGFQDEISKLTFI